MYQVGLVANNIYIHKLYKLYVIQVYFQKTIQGIYTYYIVIDFSINGLCTENLPISQLKDAYMHRTKFE